MAPIRRYLRITKYSVIECRIYLDNPALAQTWLLNPRKPVLPRVIESVRPLVLPKLREERERSRTKRSTKKKAIKDLVVEDDFEVSIFLTETTTRHSLVTKHKHFHDTTQTKLTSNSGAPPPLDVDMHAASGAITILREESDDEDLQLDAVPLAPASVTGGAAPAVAASSRPKRARRNTADAEAEDHEQQQQKGGDSDFEVIPSSDEDAYNEGGPARSATIGQPPAKRRKEAAAADETDGDDKKKMAMDISYEGFSIYGRVLCLVVKRRDQSNATGSGGGGAIGKGKQGGGTAMMENFIISTQVPAGAEAEAEATS
ncbi:hypothetical protein PG993_014668 [Apiospora rasikravindrae]|uniref:Uncharacterized protein n=1 Tax=Apiospora rasikravindrae TaxID=990691 RepID=A0ABR1RNF2_9PEZI